MNILKKLLRKKHDPIDDLVSYLTIIEGIIQQIGHHNLSDKIWMTISKIMDEFQIQQKQYNKSQKRINKLVHAFQLNESDFNLPATISFSMLIANNLEIKLNNKLLHELSSLIFELHKCYDPKLNKYDEYKLAEDMYKFWMTC